MMHFIPDKIQVKTGNKLIAVLRQEAANQLDLHLGDRIVVKNGKHSAIAILEISQNDLKKSRIGLLSELYKKLHTKRGDRIMVSAAPKPLSLTAIRRKLDGVELTKKEIDQIVKDIVADNLSDIEMTYFVAACFNNGMSDKETVALTQSIVENGSHLSFPNKIVVDKHCIGGVPGNRTTMLIVPIVTAAGLIMPKTSSRAITSPAGTADTVETLCNVTIPAERLMQIVKKVGGFMIWGGSVDLAAADDRMIRVRHPMNLDPEGMLLASIMAKKKSVGATHVLIDIPIGPQVKTPSMAQAKHLKEKFEKIGKMLGMNVHVLITDGTQPIGKGIGPNLEAIDVLQTLQNLPEGSKDLQEKVLYETGEIFELTKTTPKGKGRALAEKILFSGKAYTQMQRIIAAQGNHRIHPKKGRYTYAVCAPKNGKITAINNKTISHLARLAGAPQDAAAGIWIEKKIGDHVKKGDILFRLYAQNTVRLKEAVDQSSENGYVIH